MAKILHHDVLKDSVGGEMTSCSEHLQNTKQHGHDHKDGLPSVDILVLCKYDTNDEWTSFSQVPRNSSAVSALMAPAWLIFPANQQNMLVNNLGIC